MIRKLVTRLWLAAALIVATAQTRAQSSDEKLAELTIRDSSGQLVPIPAPNPAAPVDYITWTNATLGKGIIPNAADAYLEAYEPIQEAELDMNDDELDQALAGPWDNLPTVSTWLATIKPNLSKFRLATMRRKCYFRLPPADFSETEFWKGVHSDPRCKAWLVGSMHILAGQRAACKALVAEGWREWKRGQESRLIDNAVTILRSARHLDDQPVLLQRLAGSSSRVLAYETCRSALARSGNPDALAQQMAEKLRLDIDPPVHLRDLRCLTYEQLALRDTCQRMFTPGDQAGSWRVSKDMLAVLVPLDLETLTPGKVPADADQQLARIGYLATVREIDASFERARKFMALPYPAARKEGESLRAQRDASQNPLVKLAMFDAVHFRNLDECSTASRRATRLIVQLHVYHAEHHAFPARLDDLKTPELKELRIDPFSGRDFVYKVRGQGFALYSVAENGQDDGGQHDQLWAEKDFVFWPVPPQKKP